MKPNEQNSFNREVHQEVHTDATNGHVSTTKTTSSVPSTTVNDSKKAAYHNGYVQGEVSEHHREAKVQQVRDNDNASRGLLLGIILTSLVGLVLGTVYFLNRSDDAPAPAPVVIPVPRANQPSTSPAPVRTIEREKTIIQKIIPVPQASPAQKAAPAPQPNSVQKAAPAPQQPAPAPNINITVPNSQRPETPPQQAAPAPSAPSNNINITVPNSQKEPASTQPSPAPQSSSFPSTIKNEGTSDSGTSSGTNTESPSNSQAPSGAASDSGSGTGDAAGSQQ